MFIQFDERCSKCQRTFKAEGPAPAGAGQYRCQCPRCHTAVLLEGTTGTLAAATVGWAIPAVPHTDPAAA